MLALDAAHESVAYACAPFARDMNAKQICNAEVLAAFVALVKEACLERGHNGAATLRETLKRSALLVTEQCDIGQDHGLVLLQFVCKQILFVEEVEEEAAFNERVVDSMDVPHWIAQVSGPIEVLRMLPHHHGDVSN